MISNWIPKVGVGDLSFEQKLSENHNGLMLDEDGTGLTTYMLEADNLFVSCEGDKITHIECTNELFFLGHNLIGKPLSEFKSIVQGEWLNKNDDSITCDQLGITAWIEDDRVESITVWRP